jgi:hypothetical protein
MKRLRIILTAIALMLGIGGSIALAEESDPPCSYQQQYYKVNFSFVPAGTLGLHYACVVAPYPCTYYLPDPVLQPNNYVPCRQGVYIPIIIAP